MASIVLFDQATGRSKTVAATFEAAVLHAQLNGVLDYYVRLSVTANDLAGDPIPIFTITSQDDLVLGTTQWGGSTTPYTDLTAAVNDYVLRIHRGDPSDPDTALDFTS